MRGDLSKAESEWKKRRLFRPERRFRWRVLLMAVLLLALFLAWVGVDGLPHQISELYPWLERITDRAGGVSR